MMSLIRGVLLLFALAILHFPLSFLGAQTSAPPANVEFIVLGQANTLAKHPTLPVLYVGCYGYPEQKNLITFRLGDNGAVLTNTMKVCEDYFSVDGKNPEFMYRILPRPVVLPKENVLVLACTPNIPASFFAQTNNNECAVVALDEQGQPTKLLKAFRTSYTTIGIQLMGARADPTTRRLYLAYYVYFGWCELGADGLPVTREFVPMPVPINQWYWAYVPAWQRFFTMPPGPSLTILKPATDLRTPEFVQSIPTMPGSPLAGSLEVSESLRKIYILGSDPGRELGVYSLSKEGRLIGLPKTFSVGPAYILRADSQAKKLYAIANEWMKIFPLDVQGYPTGQPSVHSLACGVIRDALVDENTGKLYVACTEPPKAAR